MIKNDVKAEIELEAEENPELLKEMMSAGLMYGHKKNKTQPKFRPFILMTRNGVEIIDLPKTLLAIDKAAQFLKEQLKESRMILLVSTQPAGWQAMENFAKKFNLPYVKNRWIGGLITNFKVISDRIEYFKRIKNDMESGKFEKYTKKERVIINKNIERMKKMFEGLENLERRPEILFIIDPSLKGHTTAVREAKRKNIPVAAILDSDDNPELIDYPIPANDHAKASIDWVINRISNYLESNKSSESISNL